MRQAVVLDGFRSEATWPASMREIMVQELRIAGFAPEVLPLRDLDIAPCQGCFGCWIRTPGECVIADAGHDVAKAVIRSDLTVFLTPVTFGGYSSELKKAVDRLISLISPLFRRVGGEVHHRSRYRRYPRLLGLGLLGRPDPEAERIFANHIARNAINLWSPAHAAGVVYADQDKSALQARVRGLLSHVEGQP